ncbi:hypothetical protein [Microbulbifer variabilis]|uniref:hypothetical protein n=1 Tax=Microbulbifer variabilis TaxID=266805 RepID=UPI001CFDF648|nr:hypothetical protein [Microbulbifer variabilis]
MSKVTTKNCNFIREVQNVHSTQTSKELPQPNIKTHRLQECSRASSDNGAKDIPVGTPNAITSLGSTIQIESLKQALINLMENLTQTMSEDSFPSADQKINAVRASLQEMEEAATKV